MFLKHYSVSGILQKHVKVFQKQVKVSQEYYRNTLNCFRNAKVSQAHFRNTLKCFRNTLLCLMNVSETSFSVSGILQVSQPFIASGTLQKHLVCQEHYSVSGTVQKRSESGTSCRVWGLLQKHLAFQKHYSVSGTLQKHLDLFQKHFIVKCFRNILQCLRNNSETLSISKEL